MEWQRGVKPDGTTYVRHTVEVIRALTQRYAKNEDVVVGIELLNERKLPLFELYLQEICY